MKSPLWIINSSLAIIFLSIITFILLSLGSIVEKPRMASLDGASKSAAIKRVEQKTPDIKSIYEDRDLFGTYKPASFPQKVTEQLPVIPPPPVPKPIVTPETPPIVFLEPLPITINGIISSSDETKSQVTVVNNNTKKSESHRLGDKIFDAYIIRIFPKKIIIIRSNGQQETLFMYPVDAQKEIDNLKDVSWDDVVQKQSESVFLVNPKTFAERITSLAQFIERLDITTALKQDKSVGVRIGNIDPKSIGAALGLTTGDAIIKINGKAPSTTDARLAIYDELLAAPLGATIKVHIARKGQLLLHSYILNDLTYEKPLGYEGTTTPPQPPKPAAPIAQPAKKPKAPQTGKNSAVQEIKKQDKEAMKRFGTKPPAASPKK